MKKVLLNVLAVSVLGMLIACSNSNNQSNLSDNSEDLSSNESTIISSASSEAKSSSQSKESSVSSQEAGSYDEGRSIINNQLYTDSGLKVYFDAKGARISRITWGEKQIAKDGFTVGRCANRIAQGKFTLNGTSYQVTKNNNGNSLHGGGNSWQGPFANATWTKVSQTASTISYKIHSNHGDEGYPGNMDMTVTYTLKQSGELSIEYNAQSDKDTLCNPTNHLFMAINGNNSYSNISLWIDADKYTPLQNSLPTGEIKDVAGTQFDYSTEKAFDSSKNYDDNLVLNGEGYRHVATMKGTSLGIQVDVFTDRPGLQLYKDGSGSICLETQMFPDAINHDDFESPILKAGENFYSKTAYYFHTSE